MTEILLESIIKAINTELKNGLIYVVIDNNYNHYNCYEPIDIYDGGNKIGFYDDEDTRIRSRIRKIIIHYNSSK